MEGERDKRGCLVGQPRGTLRRREERVAGYKNLRRHLQVRLHEQTGEEIGIEDIEGGLGDPEAGDERREVVRDGRRRHRFHRRQSSEGSVEIRSQSGLLHRELIGESYTEHTLLVYHGVRWRRLRDKLSTG